ALSRETPILLLDEPFSGLDPLVRESIVKSLLSYLDFEEQTVIIATHEIDEIESLLDKVLVIDNGHIIEREDVEDIREFKGQSVQEWLKALMRD
ncbi:MAG TPA: ABC transporter ATP-binding protein, partial [Bacilli bacterium]|nr:ABC transporter ATP-binding protein [Bacilli bacterium]